MKTLERFLATELESLEKAHLRRRLRTFVPKMGSRVGSGGGDWIQFCSNDYLGLSRHPQVCAAAAEAIRNEGVGAGAARLVCGSRESHELLEGSLARFKGADGALTFASGYATALGVIPALVGPGDVVVLDRLAHACLVDAARLSGARLRVFRHNDLEDLERILRWAGRRGGSGATDLARSEEEPKTAVGGRVLIVTESVFSMDGDRAPLRELVAMKEAHGAWLMVDEAHATGIAGPRRRGLIEELGLEGRVEIPMGTLGKALGTAGGFVTGSSALVEFLVHRARSFVFSTAVPPVVAAAALAAVAVVEGDEGRERVARLRSNVEALNRGLAEAGWTVPPPVSPILPLMVGGEEDAMRLAAAISDQGFLVPAIRFPTVPRGRARLRVTLSSEHTPEEIQALISGLGRALELTGLRPQ